MLRWSLWRLNPFLDRKDGNNWTFDRDLEVALTAWPTSLRAPIPFPACFFSISKTGSNGKWTCHRVKVGENGQTPLTHRKKFTRQVRNRLDRTEIKLTDFPVGIQYLFQNKVTMSRIEVHWILDLGWFNEEYLVMVGSALGRFSGKLLFLRDDTVVDWLIKWAELTPAFDHSPILNLLSPCLDTADLRSLFFYQFIFPSLFCHEQSFWYHSGSRGRQ